jgi:hypothetical protein
MFKCDKINKVRGHNATMVCGRRKARRESKSRKEGKVTQSIDVQWLASPLFAKYTCCRIHFRLFSLLMAAWHDLTREKDRKIKVESFKCKNKFSGKISQI